MDYRQYVADSNLALGSGSFNEALKLKVTVPDAVKGIINRFQKLSLSS